MTDCKCNAGSHGPNAGPCFPCPVGFFCMGGEEKVMCPTAPSVGWSYCPKNEQTEANAKLEETNAKLAKMSKTLSMLKSNITEMKQCACAGGSPSSPTTSWDHMKSPTWTPSSNDIPAWNQSQYKHCQPVFNSWRDLRRQFQAGSLMARTGGLGDLMIINEYESWICVLNDLCSLGGDFYFCYVFQETTEKFVAWDQHYKLHLFQSGNLK